MRATNVNNPKEQLPILPKYLTFCFESLFRSMPTQLRRSNSEAVKLERARQLEAVLRTRNDEDLGLEVVEIEGKGRGVIARQRFLKGDPVVEYKGQMLSHKEGKKREAQISPNFANIFYSKSFSKSKCVQSFCVNASKEVPGRFGRLVNHSFKSPNCQIEVIDNFKGYPHLLIVAARDLQIGEELTIDYGVTDREVLEANPWLRES